MNEVIYHPPKRIRSIHNALRKTNRGWDVYDTTLILCCVRVFQAELDMGVPSSVATVLGHRMLADNLCSRYGCRFEYPNLVISVTKKSTVVLPTMSNVQVGDRKRRENWK